MNAERGPEKKKRRRGLIGVIVGAALASLPTPESKQALAWTQMEELESGRRAVTVEIGGHPARFVIDTGAADSFLAPHVLETLSEDDFRSDGTMSIIGIHGEERIPAANISEIEFRYGEGQGEHIRLNDVRMGIWNNPGALEQTGGILGTRAFLGSRLLFNPRTNEFHVDAGGTESRETGFQVLEGRWRHGVMVVDVEVSSNGREWHTVEGLMDTGGARIGLNPALLNAEWFQRDVRPRIRIGGIEIPPAPMGTASFPVFGEEAGVVVGMEALLSSVNMIIFDYTDREHPKLLLSPRRQTRTARNER